MADDQPISADDVARKQFATAFRGFDQYEVRAFLARVATELASMQERERSLRERLTAAEVKVPTPELVEDELEAAFGAETMRVLHAAREAAAEIRAKAEESVARLLRESNDEAARLRGEAEGVLARRSEEAEAEATTILGSAEEQAAALLAEAEASSAKTIEEAQTRGREMLAEAQAVRERILKDLSRRRKAAATQLEQLLAARERLIAAYDVVRANVDEVTHELAVVESEARLAADVAGFKAPPDDETTPDEDATVVDAPAPAPQPAAEEAVPEPEPASPLTVAAPPPAPEPAPEPEVAESPAPAVPAEERRSSSLRLLRRRSEPEAPSVPLEDDVEGVRIIRPDQTPEPTPEPTPPPRPTLVPDEPTVAETEAPEAPAPATQADEADSDTPLVEGEPAHEVEDLFARLRADRAAALAQAESVLAEPEAAAGAEVDADDPEATGETPTVTDEPDGDGIAAEAESESVFERRDATIETAERALTRALKRALADEQNEVLDTLRRMRGKPSLDGLLPSLDEHVARYARVSSEHLAYGVDAGAESLGGEAPKVDELVERLGNEIVLDVRARLARTLDSAGDDDEALVEAISAMYREWKTARSEPLARHHVAAGYAFGAFSAADESAMRWLVDAAEGGCPDCDDNALAGETPKGTAYPTGQVHPPAHAGCRCIVLPA